MCITGGDTEENRQAAFVYIEQAKSRSLADLIAFRAQELPPSTDTHRALVEQVRTLREELNWYSHALQLQENQSDHPRDAADRKAAPRVRANASIAWWKRWRTCAWRIGSSRICRAPARSIWKSIRAALPDDAMLLQYYRVQDRFMRVC